MSDVVHTVVQGETLSIIANKYKTTVGALIDLNPSLRKNPNLIFPKMSLKISNQTVPLEARILNMVFNGRVLRVYSVKNNKPVASYDAISGLPPNAPRLKELIQKGRKDLSADTNYTLPKYQNVRDAGPIQEDGYMLQLKPSMPYDKSAAAGDGAGWGVGGWILTENFMAKLGNVFGGRFGFFFIMMEGLEVHRAVLACVRGKI